MTITNSVVTANRAVPSQTVTSVVATCAANTMCQTSEGAGGGIDDWGTMTVIDSQVTDNRTSGINADGGGIVDERSRHSVVILRLRGHEDLGTTFIDVLSRYARSLADVGSKLVVVSAGRRVRGKLAATGLARLIASENVYPGNRRLGAAVQSAYADARTWIAAQPSDAPRD